jgi:hypothetical protein
VREGGTARAGTCHPSLRLFIVGRVTARGGWALRSGRGRRPTDHHRSGAIAAPSPPGRHRGRRQPASPRRAGSSGKAAGDTNRHRRAQSRLLLSAETSALRRAARTRGRVLPRTIRDSAARRPATGQLRYRIEAGPAPRRSTTRSAGLDEQRQRARSGERRAWTLPLTEAPPAHVRVLPRSLLGGDWRRASACCLDRAEAR